MVCLLGFRSWMTESSLFLTRQLIVAVSPSTTEMLSVTRFWLWTEDKEERQKRETEMAFVLEPFPSRRDKNPRVAKTLQSNTYRSAWWGVSDKMHLGRVWILNRVWKWVFVSLASLCGVSEAGLCPWYTRLRWIAAHQLVSVLVTGRWSVMACGLYFI